MEGVEGVRLDHPETTSSIYECKQCKFGMRLPVPSLQELREIYSKQLFTAYSYDLNDNEAWKITREIVNKLWGRKICKILDVGCHTGRFLNFLPKEWLKYGIEPSQTARNELSKQGIEVVSSSWEDVPEKFKNHFDGITFFDVCEHIENPVEVLRKMKKYLKPGGKIFMSTGNLKAWSRRVLGGMDYYFRSIQHISFLSPGAIENFSREENLKVEKIIRISHKATNIKKRLYEVITVFYFCCRLRKGFFRLFVRLCHLIPGLRKLCHVQVPPYTFALKDHILVILAKHD